MPAHDPRPFADELATHAGSLRALARGMLADEHLAEDVVQQAYLRALARPPDGHGFLRAWLARIVRNLALNTARGEERRGARERAVARPELDVSAERAHERAALELALQREVAAALVALDEPYRTVVHLRYFRGLAPAAIAEELGVPLKTVETRLTRAHARLRLRLARAWGEQDERVRSLWLASLSGGGRFLGGALMMKQVVLVAVGGALLAGLVLTWRAFEAPPARGEAPAVVEIPLEPPLVSAAESEPAEAREPARAPEARPEVEPAPAPLATHEIELRSALDRLALVLDRSLDGRLDPGAILDAALLVAAHDVGAALPELQLNGALAMPLLGLPEGISAELLVGSPRRNPFVSLAIHLPRTVPFLHDGLERGGSTVHVTAHLDEAGEPRSFAIQTEVEPTEEEERRAESAGTFQYTFAAALSTPMSNPRDWKLTTTDAVGKTTSEGQQQSFAYGDPPQVLEGGPWPRVDDMRRLSRRLKDLHELAKSRAAR